MRDGLKTWEMKKELWKSKLSILKLFFTIFKKIISSIKNSIDGGFTKFKDRALQILKF